MIRKNIRLRREYLFSKEQEKQNLEEYEKKYKIRKAQEGILIFSKA